MQQDNSPPQKSPLIYSDGDIELGNKSKAGLKELKIDSTKSDKTEGGQTPYGLVLLRRAINSLTQAARWFTEEGEDSLEGVDSGDVDSIVADLGDMAVDLRDIELALGVASGSPRQ